MECEAEGIMALHDPMLRALYDLKVICDFATLPCLVSLCPDLRTVRFRFDARSPHQEGCEGTWSEC